MLLVVYVYNIVLGISDLMQFHFVTVHVDGTNKVLFTATIAIDVNP